MWTTSVMCPSVARMRARRLIVPLMWLLSAVAGCGAPAQQARPVPSAAVAIGQVISEAEARRIAGKDAGSEFSNESYDVRARLEDGARWRITYLVRHHEPDTLVVGGGVVYVIDGHTGAILSKRRQQ